MHGFEKIAALIAVLAFAATGYAQSGKAGRGKYLTEEVAHCQVCHSPGLKGTGSAPDITSGGALWSVWQEKGMVKFLETGADPAGKSAAAHMPAYRLRRDDAEAIAAYLKTLR